jgi:Flp pilus assembly protein TadD
LAAAHAIHLARQTTVWEPNEASGWRTLGVAHFRLGDWPVAAAALKKALELDRNEEPLEVFFLAATDQLRGNPEQARRRFGEAVRLMDRDHDRDANQQAELRRVREEVSQVLSK